MEIGAVEDLHLPVRRELPDFLDLAGVHFRSRSSARTPNWRVKSWRQQTASYPRSMLGDSADEVATALQVRRSGPRVWRLVLSDDADWPLVLINKRVGDWHAFAMSEQFVAYAYPEILTRVAHAALVSGDMDDSGAWQSEWVRYFRWLGKDPIELGDVDEVDSDAVEELGQ